MPSKLDGPGLGMLAIGSLFAYGGLTGKSVLSELYAIVSGKSPATAPQINPIKGTGNPNAMAQSASAITGGSAEGQQIATKALSYAGHAYVYGGAPGPDGNGGWDCSSFVSYILYVQFGINIPGGQWNPSTHGPTAADYLGWSGAETIPANSVGAGDLCVWETHIGIAINNTQMISALNPQLGTAVTGIQQGGPQGESLTCRQLLS